VPKKILMVETVLEMRAMIDDDMIGEGDCSFVGYLGGARLTKKRKMCLARIIKSLCTMPPRLLFGVPLHCDYFTCIYFLPD
jgi:hypothetical protein